ncbi:hypothetical protein SteCoe_17228 [Stentor coeruleus]|uniref:Uncharacterized protein n=1 Tax=Stentor coeruleus TaxID=5963 RepID=A0A1R2BZD9_9CILI|nr:hypothetical protein SteCoe_17228 [Stentor coeruleus]
MKPMPSRGYYVGRSNSHLNFSNITSRNPTEKSVKDTLGQEKEYESIAEEAAIQNIQSPIVRRDKSVDCLKDTFTTGNSYAVLYKQKIIQLETDLDRVRQEYLRILEDKVLIEKEVICYKQRVRVLEEKMCVDELKANSVDDLNNQLKMQKSKCENLTKKHEEATKKFNDLCKIVEVERDNLDKVQKTYEDRIFKLNKDNIALKTEMSFKDQFCEKLQEELNHMKSLSKTHYENKTVKALSYIILSKDTKKPIDPTVKLKELESEYEKLVNDYNILLSKYKAYKKFTNSLINLIKAKNHQEALEFIELANPENNPNSVINHSKSSTMSTSPMKTEGNETDVNNLLNIISGLEQKVESLKIKLEVGHSEKDMLAFIQCQASVIEDYLNEDSEISQINSSLFSF